MRTITRTSSPYPVASSAVLYFLPSNRIQRINRESEEAIENEIKKGWIRETTLEEETEGEVPSPGPEAESAVPWDLRRLRALLLRRLH
jgi:hypothetical protein